jgi:uncharacterized membrane protein
MRTTVYLAIAGILGPFADSVATAVTCHAVSAVWTVVHRMAFPVTYTLEAGIACSSATAVWNMVAAIRGFVAGIVRAANAIIAIHGRTSLTFTT